MKIKNLLIPDLYIKSFVDKYLPSEVLNFGCGNRKYSEEIGVDVSKNTLADYVINSDNILPFDDASFSLVVSRFVLEHVDDLDSTISEISRVLKDDGSFIFIVPHVFSQDAFDDPTHKQFFTMRSMNYFSGNCDIHYKKRYFSKVVVKTNLFVTFPTNPILRRLLSIPLKLLSMIFPVFSEQLIKLPFIGGSLTFLCYK